jgi:hypothetical protein
MSWDNTKNKYSKEDCEKILKICEKFDYDVEDAKKSIFAAFPDRPSQRGLVVKARSLVEKFKASHEDEQQRASQFNRVLFHAFMAEFSAEELEEIFQVKNVKAKVMPLYQAACKKYNVDKLTREEYAKFKALDT